jgi:hypothetical protein
MAPTTFYVVALWQQYQFSALLVPLMMSHALCGTYQVAKIGPKKMVAPY